MREATDRGRCALAAKLWFGRFRGNSGPARVADKPKIFQSPHAAPHDCTRGHLQRRLLCDCQSTHLWIALQPRKWTPSITIDRIINFCNWVKHWIGLQGRTKKFTANGNIMFLKLAPNFLRKLLFNFLNNYFFRFLLFWNYAQSGMQKQVYLFHT